MSEALALPAPPASAAGRGPSVLRQLLLLVGIAGSVAAGIAAYMWSQQPGYVSLYANLPDKDAAAVAEALRAAELPYKLDAQTGALTVPAARVHEARLKLAAQGLPKESSTGFEMMQQEQGFGVSSFLETARYQHALETELARSVGSLQTVRQARVHLAIPKASAFAREASQPSASVLIDLQGGQSLDKDQVAAIVHMVASSVPGLQPAQVTVIDQHGRLLSKSDKDSVELTEANEQFEHSRRVEADYMRRIEQLLLPMTGAGRVSAQVTAQMDYAVTEEARESYAPEGAVLRSEQSSEQMGPPAPQGVPGATSNQPPASQPAVALNATTDTAAGGQLQSRASTRNFEIDKTLSHTRQPVGRVRKLSVAVLVDYLPRRDAKGAVVPTALTAAELQQLEKLVREAVGFDASRGDSVSVQNAAFMPLELPAPEVLPIWQQPAARDLLRQGLGGLIVLVLIFAVLRPALNSLTRPQSSLVELPAPGSAAAQEQGEDRLSLGSAQLAALAGQPPGIDPYEQKLAAARTAVAQDPKRVAQLVKNWVNDGD